MFTFDNIKASTEPTQFWTCFPSHSYFMAIFNWLVLKASIKKYWKHFCTFQNRNYSEFGRFLSKSGSERKLSKLDEFCYDYGQVENRFNIERSSVSNINF